MYICAVKYFGFIIAFFILAKPVLPLVDYWVNYDYIANELCENKAKPEMHCDGKCHLKKELAKAVEDEKSTSSSDKKNTSKQEVEVLFFENKILQLSKVLLTSTSKEVNNHYQNLYGYLTAHAVFHPPTVYTSVL